MVMKILPLLFYRKKSISIFKVTEEDKRKENSYRLTLTIISKKIILKKKFMKNNLSLLLLMIFSFTLFSQQKQSNKMKNVIVIGASGSLAKYVIDTLQNVPNVHLTLLVRDKTRIINDTTGKTIVKADVMDYPKLSTAIKGQDIVYINLAGDLEKMTNNIVKAMKENGVKRVIAISSIGIYKTPISSVLKPYRALADIIEVSGLDYTIIRPEWFTNGNEIDYHITHKPEPEIGGAVSRKSIAAFVATVVQNPENYSNDNVGISKL
ncbi:NAD(P)H-binding protein [Cloacibacterium sp.]|uniref:NAD(P)H-binding protein n=1 Tax=Cloacibacterium sp. TaxID=1913682 RepID=UPI0039E3A61A